MYYIQWRSERKQRGCPRGNGRGGGIPAILGKYIIWTEYKLINNHQVCFMKKKFFTAVNLAPPP